MQVEQAAEDVKRREVVLARREGDLARLEAAASSSQAEGLKRDLDLSNREQALAAQLAKVKAAESQLQSKQLEAKELQVSLVTVNMPLTCVYVVVVLSHWCSAICMLRPLSCDIFHGMRQGCAARILQPIQGTGHHFLIALVKCKTFVLCHAVLGTVQTSQSAAGYSRELLSIS